MGVTPCVVAGYRGFIGPGPSASLEGERGSSVRTALKRPRFGSLGVDADQLRRTSTARRRRRPSTARRRPRSRSPRAMSGARLQRQPPRATGEEDDVVELPSSPDAGRRRRPVSPSHGIRSRCRAARPTAAAASRCSSIRPAQAVDLDDDPVVELEQPQPPEADLGEHARRGDVLDPAAADQLLQAAALERLVARGERRFGAIPCRQRSGRTK